MQISSASRPCIVAVVALACGVDVMGGCVGHAEPEGVSGPNQERSLVPPIRAATERSRRGRTMKRQYIARSGGGVKQILRPDARATAPAPTAVWDHRWMSASDQSTLVTRWALIGASDIAATRMIPAIRAHGGHIEVVQSGSADWGTEYAERHGIDEWTTSVENAVARSDVDAVYVSSHNAKHHSQVIAAARAGKHVLAEKPLALSVEDARAMVEACRAARVVLGTNHHLPSSPVHMAMKEIVASGEIGRIRAIHVSHAVGLPDHLRGWRIDDPVGGGVVLDVFIHDMAAIAAIIGGQAQTVRAAARTGPDVPAAPDSVMTVVEWSNDVIVQTHDSYDNYDLPTSLDILGDEGAISSVM